MIEANLPTIYLQKLFTLLLMMNAALATGDASPPSFIVGAFFISLLIRRSSLEYSVQSSRRR